MGKDSLMFLYAGFLVSCNIWIRATLSPCIACHRTHSRPADLAESLFFVHMMNSLRTECSYCASLHMISKFLHSMPPCISLHMISSALSTFLLHLTQRSPQPSPVLRRNDGPSSAIEKGCRNDYITKTRVRPSRLSSVSARRLKCPVYYGRQSSAR